MSGTVNNSEGCCSDQGCCSTDQPSGGNGAGNRTENRFSFPDHPGIIVSFILLITGLALDYLFQSPWFSGPVRLLWYLTAYIPVGLPVLRQAAANLRRGDVFTEFFLMGIATAGAFFIGEYPEGVAVMLFYSIGEAFQEGAVRRARNNIKALLDVRPETAHVLRGQSFSTVHPDSVEIGQTIQVRPGERVPLDGRLLTGRGAYDTSALTGESKPRHYAEGEKVLAGMISLDQVAELEVSSTYENSSISRILKMVREASSRKARTELFLRSFARVYTPAVVGLATLLVLLPAFFASPYVFEDWLYRGLVFLVISCPCALVISIPLGYFGGIGAASHHGILVKGSNFLDTLRSVTTVVFDKTGTLTKGTFSVQDVQLAGGADGTGSGGGDRDVLPLLLAVEKGSTHPIAKAITDHIGPRVHSVPPVEDQQEIPGYGIRATVSGKKVVVGSRKLMEMEQVFLNGFSDEGTGSVVHIAIDGRHEGAVTISDQIKPDAAQAIEKLRKLGIRQTVMLSGDTMSVARQVGSELNIDRVYADLLPDEKARKLDELKAEFPGTIAYAGDGINDAPVLALSDVGIAMGALGSDVAIETADVVIQTDQLSKIAEAIGIGRATRRIVWQNIILAMGIKILVLAMGALGMATLWRRCLPMWA
ncbi:MAG: heavy metal translocating P-type ATPase [Balneolaceae bacterium]